MYLKVNLSPNNPIKCVFLLFFFNQRKGSKEKLGEGRADVLKMWTSVGLSVRCFKNLLTCPGLNPSITLE